MYNANVRNPLEAPSLIFCLHKGDLNSWLSRGGCEIEIDTSDRMFLCFKIFALLRGLTAAFSIDPSRVPCVNRSKLLLYCRKQVRLYIDDVRVIDELAGAHS